MPVQSLVCRNCRYALYGLRDTRCPECGEPFTWEQALDDYRRSVDPDYDPHVANSPPPDWGMVPFAVGCARCGQDLRGLSHPACPACGLRFDWAQAVPVESLVCCHCDYHLYGLQDTRCPECGEPFTWEQALDDYHRSRKPLFEYRWRDEPVRSLIRTWRLALRPKKLWSAIDLHDPPKVRPLGGLVLMAGAMAVVSVVAPAAVYDVVDYVRWMAALRQRGIPYSQMGYTLWNCVTSALSDPGVWNAVRLLVSWWGWSFASLMIFQQSMRLGRVRVVHVFRTWVYAIVMLPPILAMFTAPLVVIEAIFAGWFFRPEFLAITVAAFGFALILGTRSLTLAYKRYLKLPHALGVVVSSQVIAVLATLVTHLLLFLYG